MHKLISALFVLVLFSSAANAQAQRISSFPTLTVKGLNNNSIVIDPSNIANSTTLHIYGPLHLYSDSTSLTYSLTGTPAAVTSSTPLVITQPGTYVLSAIVQTNFAASTFAANQNASCYLYRTNNTPAIITNTKSIRLIPVMTTTTLVGPTLEMGAVSYTTSNATDSLSVYCSVTATPSAGAYKVTATHISAVRVGM